MSLTMTYSQGQREERKKNAQNDTTGIVSIVNIDKLDVHVKERPNVDREVVKRKFVEVLSRALRMLGYGNSLSKKYQIWAESLASAYLGKYRVFHSYEHILRLCECESPIQMIAALFHDMAYFQVDGGYPADHKELLTGIMSEEKGLDNPWSYRIKHNKKSVHVNVVMAVFGVKPGDVIDTSEGLNEFASALIAMDCLKDYVHIVQLAKICACIEGTIPFRTLSEWTTTLYDRLYNANLDFKLEMGAEEIKKVVHESVALGNRDVGDFGDVWSINFLLGTWELLPEYNPALRVGNKCSVRDWRSALQKTNLFLTTLKIENIFSSFLGVPNKAEMTKLHNRVKINVGMSRLYTGVKLAVALLIESLFLQKNAFQIESSLKDFESSHIPDYVTLRIESQAKGASELRMSSLMKLFEEDNLMCNNKIDNYLSKKSAILCASSTWDDIDAFVDSVKSAGPGDASEALTHKQASRISKLFPKWFVDEIFM